MSNCQLSYETFGLHSKIKKQNFPACIKAWANEFGDHFSSPMSLSMAKKLFQPQKENVSYFPFGPPVNIMHFQISKWQRSSISNNSDSSSKRNQRHPKSVADVSRQNHALELLVRSLFYAVLLVLPFLPFISFCTVATLSPFLPTLFKVLEF